MRELIAPQVLTKQYTKYGRLIKGSSDYKRLINRVFLGGYLRITGMHTKYYVIKSVNAGAPDIINRASVNILISMLTNLIRLHN